MKATIIGSLSRKDKMEEAKSFFENLGFEVDAPSDEGLQGQALIMIQNQWIKKISESDLVVAIPKETVLTDTAGKTIYTQEFGESTSYEIAIAYAVSKNVIIWV